MSTTTSPAPRRVIERGTEAAFNDKFIVDAIDDKTGEEVLLVVFCRSLQSVSIYLNGYTPTLIR